MQEVRLHTPGSHHPGDLPAIRAQRDPERGAFHPEQLQADGDVCAFAAEGLGEGGESRHVRPLISSSRKSTLSTAGLRAMV